MAKTHGGVCSINTPARTVWRRDYTPILPHPALPYSDDEAIKREHTGYIAATIPHAGLLILPNTSLSAGPAAIQFRHAALPGRRVGQDPIGGRDTANAGRGVRERANRAFTNSGGKMPKAANPA
jgi:hypothetical protein